MQETRRAVLDAIADGPVSGPDLATELGVSRAAVWKHVEALREAGFEVESETGGYVLSAVPEYGGPAVEYGLDAFFDVEFHDTISSTNARARDLAAAGETDVCVLANAQTGGRGRLDRAWDSPPGGVWLSVLFRPDVPSVHAPLYTLAAAVAVTRAVRAEGVDAGIKWPNDVLVRGRGGTDNDEGRGDGVGGNDNEDGTGGTAEDDGDSVEHGDTKENAERKLAGVLTEMRGEADRIDWIVVGVGLNANIDAGALPAGATSLREEVGDTDRRTLVLRLLREFDRLRSDPDAILPAWREYALSLGRRVRVETARGTITGEAVGISFPGSLEVDTAEGRRAVSVGDCEHLQPA